MQLAVLLLVVCVSLVFSQTPNQFEVDYSISGPSINGRLLGVMKYSEADRAILMEQADGYKDLAVFSDDQNSLFRYYSCGGNNCEIEPIDVNDDFPLYYKQASDSCAGSATPVPSPTPLATTCTVCTRSDNSNVANICVDNNDNVIYVTLEDTRVITWLSATRGGVVSADFTPFTGCVLNCYAELDIVMVIDESGSISGNYIPSLGVDQGEWSLQRNFAVEFVKGFEIGPKKVHMGLVQFSKSSRKIIAAPHIISDQASIDRIFDGLTKILCSSDPRRWNQDTSCRGATWTGHAMIDAITILRDQSGSRALRRNAGKIAVVVTDGNSWYQNQNSFTYVDVEGNPRTFSHPTGWQNYVKEFHDEITVITVGVGTDVNMNELRYYSSLDANGDPLAFQASTFDFLRSAEFIEQLGRSVCTASGAVASCGGTCRGSCQCGTCGCPTDCEDNNACTEGACTATQNTAGGCFFTDIVCDDGNYCTNDICDPITGCGTTPVDCDDGNACTIDTCNPTTGCVHTPVECPTTNFCWLSECQPADGQCSPEVYNDVCLVQNDCTVAAPSGSSVDFLPKDCSGTDLCVIYDCDINVPGGCVERPKTCSDGNNCTIDTCLPNGECEYELKPCDDGNMCTDASCDSVTGCQFTPFVVEDRCDDGNICTVDSCDPDTGCVHTPIECPTTTDDACIVGVCDPIDGCIEVPRTCEVSAENATCGIAICTEGECRESVTDLCANDDLLAAAIAATTTLIVVIVIIAAVVCLGATAGGAYAAFSAVSPGDFDNTSAIYEQNTQIGVSAIHE